MEVSGGDIKKIYSLLQKTGGTCSMAAMDHLTDGADLQVPQEVTELNDAEARNLAFLVSHRLGRNGSSLMSPTNADEPEILKLADDVAARLRKLSLRLGSEAARARITCFDVA